MGLLPVGAQNVHFDLLSVCYHVLTHKITRLEREGDESRDRKLISNNISHLRGRVITNGYMFLFEVIKHVLVLIGCM